jgi:hypothetical protein
LIKSGKEPKTGKETESIEIRARKQFFSPKDVFGGPSFSMSEKKSPEKHIFRHGEDATIEVQGHKLKQKITKLKQKITKLKYKVKKLKQKITKLKYKITKHRAKNEV